MVTDFGMSRLGRIHLGAGETNPFLGSLAGEERVGLVSEETAREIDEEVRRILEENLSRARDILDARRPALEALAQRLLQVESIDADELKQIVEANTARPFVVPSPLGTSPSASRKAEPGAESDSGSPDSDWSGRQPSS